MNNKYYEISKLFFMAVYINKSQNMDFHKIILTLIQVTTLHHQRPDHLNLLQSQPSKVKQHVIILQASLFSKMLTTCPLTRVEEEAYKQAIQQKYRESTGANHLPQRIPVKSYHARLCLNMPYKNKVTIITTKMNLNSTYSQNHPIHKSI